MKRIYADYAATTPLCLPARRAMHDAFDIFGNPSSLYREGVEAREMVEEARSKVAKAINAEPDEIYFTSGATEANNWVHRIHGVFGSFATTRIEHKSVYGGCAPRIIWPVTQLGQVDEDDLRDRLLAIDVVSIGLINNEVGAIQSLGSNINYIKFEAKRTGNRHLQRSLFHTDATQAVGHIPVDVKELGVDMLSMSAHKFGGPKGVGALFVRRGVDMPPLFRGGHQEAGKRAGTENIVGIAGMGAAIEWAVNGLDKSIPYLTRLRDILIDGILDIPGAELTGHPTQRSPSIASFVFSGIEGQALVLALDERGVCASSGSACSEGQVGISHVLKAMGYTEETGRGSLRLSIGWGTTEEDVRYIIRAAKDSVEELRK